MRTEKWRYIRYNNGGEELYDEDQDQYEWKNLANDGKFASVKNELAKHMPQINKPRPPSTEKDSEPGESDERKERRRNRLGQTGQQRPAKKQNEN